MKDILTLFFEFFKIGLFTFGGGYAMISQVRETVVEKKKWLSDDELMHIITVSESTPGPIAINMATFVGYKRKGFFGSVAATVGVVLPSFIIIYIISFFADKVKDNIYVKYAFVGIKAAVAFLIIKTGVSLFSKMKKNLLTVLSFAAVFCGFLVFEFVSVSFSSVLYILFGGILGIVFYSLLKYKEGDV